MAAAIRSVIVKVAERCNLNCTYCYMYNQADRTYRGKPVFMSRDVFRRMIERVADYCDRHAPWRMGIVLHGGEPMLCDPAALDEWISDAEATASGRIAWTVQTNATLVSEAWIQLIAAHGMRCSVSIDGTPTSHNLFRVTHDGEGSYDAVVRGFRRLVEAGRDPGVLCVINPSADGAEVYHHLRSLGARRFNFLIPDVSRDARPVLYGHVPPGQLARFLCGAFDAWFAEDDPDVYVHLFCETIRMLHGASSRTDALGNLMENYLVVDTNGDILANDALKVCFAGAADSGLNVRTHGFHQLEEAQPVFAKLLRDGVPLCGTCLGCAEHEVCGGGALPNRYASGTGFSNPSAWCEDLFAFIGHVRRRVAHMLPQLVPASL